MAKGYIDNIDQRAKSNHLFRRELYSGPQLQLLLMTIMPGREVGEEVHARQEQFFGIVAGRGTVVLDGMAFNIFPGDAIVVPPGVRHNLIAREEPLQLFTLYAPPNPRAARM